MRASLRLVQLCLCVSFLTLLATPTLGDEIAVKTVQVQVDHAPIELLTRPPTVTPEELALLESRLDDLARIRQKTYLVPTNGTDVSADDGSLRATEYSSSARRFQYFPEHAHDRRFHQQFDVQHE